MNRIIRNFICFWHVVICLPSSCSKEAILKDDTMKEWFQQIFSVSGAGELWTISGSNTFYETCGSGNYADFWFISNHVPLNFNGTFANLIYVNVETGKFELCANMGWTNGRSASETSETCGDGGDADFWLISNHVTLYLNGTFIADLIYVDVETGEFELCAGMGVRNSAPCYSNYFEVYIYRGQNQPNFPDLNDKPALRKYLLSNFSPVYNITNNTSPQAVNGKNNQIFTFLQNKSEGVTFGIRSRGACGKIYRMKMYYYYCEETCRNRVTFHKTISPANGSKQVLGICSNNSAPSNNETNFNGSCSRNGTWFIPNTINCSCIQGYSSDDQDCQCLLPRTMSTSSQNTAPKTTILSTSSQNAASKTTIMINTMREENDKSRDNEDFPLRYIIIIAAGSGVLLFIAIALFIVVSIRRRKRKKRPTQGILNNGMELPDVGQRTYVDPTIYDRPEDALFQFTNELDSSLLFLEMMIGGGEFGDVYKGKMTKPDGSKIPVAVKTLKHDATIKSEKDFMLEASAMGQFDNPNVIRLEGVVTKSKPRMIVLEFMNNGSLDNYLKINDGKLTVLQLIGMARGVAAGMKYLAEINFVHRDLAARNILVNDSLFCKVADFGLSRGLETTDSSRGEYATTGGRIPVRWTAPEAISYRKFSSASDVWSYGILLWEIMSFAERPYWNWDNFKVIQQLDEGYRLPPPIGCPRVVHELMLQCWKEKRNERPTFADISLTVDKWIRSPEKIDDNAEAMSALAEWLESIKMQNYLPKFASAGYKYPSQLAALKDEDLQSFGISLIGHRNKILKNVKFLHVNNNENQQTKVQD